jgi:hypothetical protein
MLPEQFLDDQGWPKPDGAVDGRPAAIETWGRDLDARWRAGEIVCFGYDARDREWRWLPDRDDLRFEESGKAILIGGRPGGGGMVYSRLVFYRNGQPRDARPTPKPTAEGSWQIALGILEGEAAPPPGRGCLIALARAVCTEHQKAGHILKEDTVLKQIRRSFRDWEKINPSS